MSEDETTGEQTAEQAATATLVPDQPFDRKEIEQFDTDDITAGAHIGKMLALMFMYTIFATSLVGWFTWNAVSQ